MPTSQSHRLRFTVTSPPIVGLPNAPAWAQSYVVGEWNPFTLNLLKDVDPEDDPAVNLNWPANANWHGTIGQCGQMNAWSGGALVTPGTYDQYGGIIVYGGNRANYYGSEVPYLDFGTRQWRRLSDPYPNPDARTTAPWPYPDGEYPDGSAVPSHTYTQVHYHPGSKTFWHMRSAAQLPNPTATGGAYYPHRFKLDTATWAKGTPANAGSGPVPFSIAGSRGCYDRTRDCFWEFTGQNSGSPGYDVYQFYDLGVVNGDGTYGKCRRFGLRQYESNQCSVEHDPVDDIFIYNSWESYFNYRMRAVKCTDVMLGGLTEATILTESGTRPPNKSTGWGVAWSEGLQSMLFLDRNGGADLYRLQKPSVAWQTNAWVWSILTAGSNVNAVPPMQDESGQPCTNGIYSRLRVVKYADMELVVCVTRRDLPAYAMRIL